MDEKWKVKRLRMIWFFSGMFLKLSYKIFDDVIVIAALK